MKYRVKQRRHYCQCLTISSRVCNGSLQMFVPGIQHDVYLSIGSVISSCHILSYHHDKFFQSYSTHSLLKVLCTVHSTQKTGILVHWREIDHRLEFQSSLNETEIHFNLFPIQVFRLDKVWTNLLNTQHRENFCVGNVPNLNVCL